MTTFRSDSQDQAADLLELCCDQWGMSIAEFRGKDRHNRVMLCRYAYALMARAHTPASHRTIADVCNSTSHTTNVNRCTEARALLAGESCGRRGELVRLIASASIRLRESGKWLVGNEDDYALVSRCLNEARGLEVA